MKLLISNFTLQILFWLGKPNDSIMTNHLLILIKSIDLWIISTTITSYTARNLYVKSIKHLLSKFKMFLSLIGRVPIANFQVGISVIGTETVGIYRERVGWGTGNFKRWIEYSLDSDFLFCNIFRDNKTVSRALTVLKEPSPGVRPSCQMNQLALVMQNRATYLHLKSFMRLAHLCSQCM